MEQAQSITEGRPLWSILMEAVQVADSNPGQAEEYARAVLKFAPGQQHALQFLADTKRVHGDLAGARTMLESMAAELPGLASIHYELGLLLAEMGETEAAVHSLSRVVELEPKHPHAWRTLGDALVQTGDADRAAEAYARQFASSILDVKMLEEVNALPAEHADAAEDVLREYLDIYPTDLVALQMLGRMLLRASQFESAEHLFKHAIDLVPSFSSARLDYISTLHQQLKYEEESDQ